MNDNYVRDRTIQRPVLPGHIYMWQIKTSGNCAGGQRNFYLRNGLTRDEVFHFIQHGMPIEEFKKRFGHDHQAMLSIRFWEKHYQDQE